MRRERRILGVPIVQTVRPYGLGIDVAKQFHAVCLLLPAAQQIQRVEFECDNTPKGLQAAKRKLLRLIPPEHVGQGLSYTLESTSTYHCPLVRAWGGQACIVNPALAVSFKARKTDRIDAYKLATQHLEGLWPPSYQPTAEAEVLRTLCRTRRRILRQITRLHNSITTRLFQWNCADQRRTAKDKFIRACVEDLAAGRYQGACEAFADHHHVPDTIWSMLERLYWLADQSKAVQDWIEAEIQQRVAGDLFQRLMTFPGVGRVMAATWVSEVEPCSRFPTTGHCVAFCGLDPTPQISGGKQVGSKLRGGNSNIRPALIQAGHILLNGRSSLASSILARGGPRKRLVCIAARKLVKLLYLSSLKGITYDDAKAKTPGESDADASADARPRCGTDGRPSDTRGGAASVA